MLARSTRLTQPLRSPSPGSRLRGLLDEAWRRARRRRRLIAAPIAMAAAVVVAVLVVVRHDGHSAGTGELPGRTVALALPRPPGMGVACPGAPNSIACDRVGIAVWLSTDPDRVVATVGGHSVLLHDRHITCGTQRSCPRLYDGNLQPAGLLDGALKVIPDQGADRWYGRHPVTGTMRITATYADGTKAVATRRVPLAPGWG